MNDSDGRPKRRRTSLVALIAGGLLTVLGALTVIDASSAVSVLPSGWAGTPITKPTHVLFAVVPMGMALAIAAFRPRRPAVLAVALLLLLYPLSVGAASLVDSMLTVGGQPDGMQSDVVADVQRTTDASLLLGVPGWFATAILHSVARPGHLSPLGAIHFVLLSLSLAALLVRRWRRTVLAILWVVALTSLFVAVAIFLGANPDRLPEVWFVTMAPAIKLSFLLAAIGGLALEPSRGLVGELRGNEAGARMMRRWMPVVVIVPIVLGVLRYQAELAGWISGRLGVVIMIAVLVTVLLGMAWSSARQLNREGRARRIAREQLEHEVDKQRRLTGQLRRLAVQLSSAEHQERRRVATTLHENFQQVLAAGNYQLLAAMRRCGPDSATVLEPVRKLLQDAIDMSRTLAVELAPPELYQHGLVAAVRAMAKRYLMTFDLPVRVIACNECDVPQESIRAFMYQAVNELLLNVVKHARATRAWVTMRSDLHGLTVRVSDNGQGPVTEASDLEAPAVLTSSTVGFGTFYIRQRLEYLGGTLVVDGRPGRGHRVTMSVPWMSSGSESDD